MLKSKIKAEQLKVKYSHKKSSEPQIQAEQIKPVKYQQQIHETDIPESQNHAKPVIPVKYQHDVEVDTTELEPSRLPLMILGISFLLGIVGVFLFQNLSFGFNLSLFIFLLIISLLFVKNLAQQPLGSSQYLLMATGLFFAITLIWRSALILNALSFLGLFLTIYLAYTLGTRKKLPALEVSEAIQDFFLLIKYIIKSYYQLITQDIQWHELKQYWKPSFRAILKGLTITIPFLLLLAVLLIEVDIYLFHNAGSDLKWLEIGLQYVITFFLCSWIAVAFLSGSVLNQENTVEPPRTILPSWQIGRIEFVMILGTVNLLLLVAILNSDAWIDWTTTLTPATENLNTSVDLSKEQTQTISTQCSFLQLLKKGDWVGHLSEEALSLWCSFFQWMTVAVLVIILLLLMQWLYKPASPLEETTYKLLIYLMIFLTLFLEYTVIDRLYSYTDQDGWTEARFYAFIALRWWLVLFIWFTIIFIRKQQQYFAFGTIVITLIFIGLLHFINPDERLAQANLSRLQAGKSYDMNSVASLSPDAFSIVITQLPVLSKHNRCQLLQHIQKYQTNVFPPSSDWRSWHWTQKKTQESLQKVQPILLLLPEEQHCD